MKRTALFIAALASVFTFAGVTIASAGTGTSTLAVGTSVISQCTQMPTSVAITLPNYDVFSGNFTASSATHYSLNCTKGSSPVISFPSGDNSCNGTYPGNWCRSLTDSNGDKLTYVPVLCYQPFTYNGGPIQFGTWCNSMTTAYASTYPTAPAAQGNGSSEATNLYFFAGANPGQDVPVGTYSDSFTIVLNY